MSEREREREPEVSEIETETVPVVPVDQRDCSSAPVESALKPFYASYPCSRGFFLDFVMQRIPLEG